MNEPTVLTADAVAQLLGVDVGVVLKWVDEGAIPHFRLGEHALFRSETLDLWFRKLEFENPSNAEFRALLAEPRGVGLLLDDVNRAIEQLRGGDEDLRRAGAFALAAAAKTFPGASDQIAQIIVRFIKRSSDALRDSDAVVGARSEVYALLEALASLGLEKIDLRDAYLRGLAFKGIDLPRAVLVNADFRGAVLPEANLTRATMKWADFTDAVLASANLSIAKLVSAKLVRANLQRASLRDADLTGADLTGCLLDGADLSGANLCDVVGLDHVQLASATLDDRTQLPVALRGTVRIGTDSLGERTTSPEPPTLALGSREEAG